MCPSNQSNPYTHTRLTLIFILTFTRLTPTPCPSKAVNASLPEAHVELFAALWGKFLNRTQPSALTAAEVSAAWTNLTLHASGSAVLRPQSAGDCAAYGRCVGVEVVRQKNLNSSGWTKGNCVCYN